MKNILIIGCGLLGSSLLRRIHKKKLAKKIFVYEKSKKNISKIKRLKLPGILVKKLQDAVSQSDLIIFCTPMSEYKKIILKINNNLTSKKIITDIGSSKSKSSEIIKKNLKKQVFWTSSHPITGSEVSGPEHGREDLFENKWCVLIKDKNTKKKHIQILSKFWSKIGSKIIFMNSKEHDHIFSITSHIPHLVAYNMVKTAMNFEKKKKSNIVKFSAGGLRDFTRTAASNEVMWKDIFLNNKENIIKGIDLFMNNLREFKRLINMKNEKKLIKIMKDSKKIRKKIISSKQDVNLPDFGRR